MLFLINKPKKHVPSGYKLNHQQHETQTTSLSDSIKQDIQKLNRFNIRVGRIHIGHKELSSSSSMDYRKAGLVIIEQGVSDTLCSLDPDLIPWDILHQVEVFFEYLDRHIFDDIEFWDFNAYAVPDQAIYDLSSGILERMGRAC